MVVRTIWGGIVKIRPSPGPERELQKTWPGYDEDTVLLGYAQPTPGPLAILNERTTNEISSLKRCRRFFFSSFRFLPMFWRLAISWGRRNSKFDLYPNLVVIKWVLENAQNCFRRCFTWICLFDACKKVPKNILQTSVERNLQKKNLKNKSMFRIVEVSIFSRWTLVALGKSPNNRFKRALKTFPQ